MFFSLKGQNKTKDGKKKKQKTNPTSIKDWSIMLKGELQINYPHIHLLQR